MQINYKIGQFVWFINCGRPTKTEIKEIKITKYGISIELKKNSSRVSPEELFATKKEAKAFLIDSLQKELDELKDSND